MYAPSRLIPSADPFVEGRNGLRLQNRGKTYPTALSISRRRDTSKINIYTTFIRAMPTFCRESCSLAEVMKPELEQQEHPSYLLNPQQHHPKMSYH
jgi:hypothetical protein